MKATHILPTGYRQILSIDLQKDPKTAALVNALAVVIMLVLAIPMHFFVPIFALFEPKDGLAIRLLVMSALMIVYLILHELVHGITMKLCGTKKVTYGFTGMYAFASSEDYYGKCSYIIIALAPVVVWGIVLAIVNAVVPSNWFWIVYLIQIINISGAAGDLYVTAKFMKLPKDILVKDVGVAMTVYSRESLGIPQENQEFFHS